MNRMEDFLSATKLGEMMHKQKQQEKSKACMCLCVIASIVALAAIVFCIIKYMNPKMKCKCMEDFEDDFEDELDDDFFEDDEVTE